MLQQNVILTGKTGFNWFKLVFFGSVWSMLSQQPVAHFWGKNRIGPDLKTLFLFTKVVTCELQIIEVSMWPMSFKKKKNKKSGRFYFKGFFKKQKSGCHKRKSFAQGANDFLLWKISKSSRPYLKGVFRKAKKAAAPILKGFQKSSHLFFKGFSRKAAAPIFRAVHRRYIYGSTASVPIP